jgi:hypothetical protein
MRIEIAARAGIDDVQRAIDAVHDAGGGEVVLAPGAYHWPHAARLPLNVGLVAHNVSLVVGPS